MKKFNTTKIAVLMLVLTLITSCFVGGTFAKYTAEISATDNARVAKFAVEAFGTDAVANDSATIELFDVAAVYDLAGVTDDDVSAVAGTPDADIKTAADGTAIIAPGSWGTFDIEVANTSEVTVSYALAFTDSKEAGVPLQWSADGKTWEEDLTSLNVSASADTYLDAETGTDTVTIYWKWDFDGDDDVDTELGKDGTAAPSVKAAVTFTQVD